MGKKAPSMPAPPDPVATAQAQGQMNIETARAQNNMNRVNQVTPYGNLTFTNAGRSRDEWLANDRNNAMSEGKAMFGSEAEAQAAGASNYWAPDAASRYFEQQGLGDNWTATTTLSPEQQNLLNLSNQAQDIYGRAAVSQLGQASQALSSPFEFSGPALQSRPDFTGIGDPNQSRDAVEQALLSRINPQLEQDRAALEARLANQGITMGSQAWQSGMGDFGQQANDARYGAILNAGQEQSRMFGLGLQQAGMGNAARQQSLQEQLALRAQPINEAAALLSGQQVQQPQFAQAPQVGLQAPDYQGAVAQNYAGQMAGWNAQNQAIGQQNAAFGSLLGNLGGAAIMGGPSLLKWSDRRLKRDVQRIGTGAHGLPVYAYTYLWGEPAVGYMADEVAAVAPDAVQVGPGGYAMVDYGALA